MQKLDRRELLGGTLAGAVAVGLHTAAVAEDTPLLQPPLIQDEQRGRVIDTNVSLFQWPFRRLPLSQTDVLLQKLRAHGIDQAWAGSFEGLLHRDVAGVNSRLAAECQKYGSDILVPFGTVNPGLPDWEEDLRRCHEEHRMPGIRLHPNYHGYTLHDPRFERLMHLAAERQLIVQLATAMEDQRTQHPLMHVADVDLTPLPEAIRRVPGGKPVILNHKATGAVFASLMKIPGVYFDMSRVNATDGIARVMRTLPPDRVVFGTHAPFLIYESAMIKVYESDLKETETRAVLHQNAERLLSKTGV
ncbi:MAG TPA: metal-dependent hydrolase [Planctomycetes bacterium]|nr:metal-dependent hydrolase [Fuerstiella sp.]HIK95614.1 metal-dependent hydrolase [Planctomycetota bacterium]